MIKNPDSWKDADGILNQLNINGLDFMKWNFDCNFKLDYDGEILSISSRFYPPYGYYGPGWDGYITLYLGDKSVYEKEIKCNNLTDLKKQAEIEVNKIIKKVRKIIFKIFKKHNLKI